MGGTQARRLCPRPWSFLRGCHAYSEASKAVFEVFEDDDPARRGALDRRSLPRRPRVRAAGGVADRDGGPAQEAVLAQVGLPITVGIARTKFLAKVASGVAKPDGLLVVPPDDELGSSTLLPVERLWGVGPATAAKLRARGITTVGQVAWLEEAALVSMLGRAAGRHLHALAHNLDPRPVRVGRRRRSIGAQRALGRRRGRSTRSTSPSSGSPTGSGGGSERPAFHPDDRAPAALRRFLASDTFAHAPACDGRDAAILTRFEGPARRGDSDHPGSGSHPCRAHAHGPRGLRATPS